MQMGPMMIFKFFRKFTFWIMLLFDEVRFRDAELSRICKSDYRIRIHQAHESSDGAEAGWRGLILQSTEMPLPMAVL